MSSQTELVREERKTEVYVFVGWHNGASIRTGYSEFGKDLAGMISQFGLPDILEIRKEETGEALGEFKNMLNLWY